MMGHQAHTASLFYYVRLEDQIPESHLLRLIHTHVDFSFVRQRLEPYYSATGRPSIDPEVLVRLLLLGYLYGITSERRLIEEVRMHLGYRWFVGVGLDQDVPDHSTLSKNRHGRFRQAGVFREVFEEIVRRCLAAGFVEGRQLAVDGTWRPMLARAAESHPRNLSNGHRSRRPSRNTSRSSKRAIQSKRERSSGRHRPSPHPCPTRSL